MCFPKRFKTLITIIFRGWLKNVNPNEVLGDIMTEDQYNNNDDDDEVMKKVDDDKKKKCVAFKLALHPRARTGARPTRKNQVMRSAPMMIVMMKL